MAVKKVTVESRLGERYVIESDIRGHRVVLDQPVNVAGTDTGPTSLELMLAALAGCIGTMGRVIAMQRKINLRGMHIKVEGELELDGLLGKSAEKRTGFDGLTITVDVDADMTDEEKEAFLHEVDLRCPVSENLLNNTPINVKLA